MKIRNGLYTLVEGKFYQISEIRSDVPITHLEKKYLIQEGQSLLNKSKTIISAADLENAVEIKTYCSYKGSLLQVFRFSRDEEDKIQIASRDENVANYLEMKKIRADWFMKQISIKDVDEIWEERLPDLSFSLPKNLAKKKIIPPSW